jgi:anti-sigma factor RsiW
MSAPTPDFDQLLSDHLDGMLSDADAQLLRRIMRDEPALQSQYDALLADRQQLQALFATPSSSAAKLPSDFAARVLAESRRRRLPGGHHPSEDMPSVELPTSAREIYRSPLAIGLAALAAVLLLTATLSMRGFDDTANTQSLAQNLPATASLPDLTIIPDLDPLPDETRANGEMIAARIPDATLPDATLPDATVPASMNVENKPSLDSVASADASPSAMRSNESVSLGDQRPLLAGPSLSGAVMVYDVRLSPKGRAMGALSSAMQRIGLDDTSRRPINRDVIDAARQANSFDEQESFQIVFVQASAKKIDRLFLSLLKDQEAVRSVGLSLVTNTPILEMANQLVHADATQVKHDRPLSVELGSEDDRELAALRELLGDQAFLPMDADSMADSADVGSELSSSGSDVITRVLILVR